MAKFEIHLCPKRGVPVCGNLIGGTKYLFVKSERDNVWKAEASGQNFVDFDFERSLKGQTQYIVAAAKFYFELVGPKFNRRWYSWNVAHFVYRPLPKSAWPFLRNGKMSFRGSCVEAALAVNEALWRADHDGLQNLMPLIILFGREPKELKELLGKGVWKKLAANTKNRNNLICRLAGKHGDGVEFVTFLTTIPSSVIGYFARSHGPLAYSYDEIEAACHSARLSHETIDRRLRIFRETFELLARDGRKCNPSWSDHRLLAEHNRAVKSQAASRLHASSPRIFCDAFHWRSPSSCYAARRLRSEREIASEAIEQRHCVSIYSKKARDGSYAVFEISGAQRATLGVNISRSPKGCFECDIDQVTLVFNGPASGETTRFCDAAVNQFTKTLNGLAHCCLSSQPENFGTPLSTQPQILGDTQSAPDHP